MQVVEVRASLLSGESERFLLKDVFRVWILLCDFFYENTAAFKLCSHFDLVVTLYVLQVGDVVLVQDETVMDTETPMIGLESLV